MTFGEDEITMDLLFSEEDLLDFALHYLSMQNSDDEAHPVAEKIAVTYIMREFQKQDKEDFTVQDVNDRFEELLASYILTSLVNKGVAEVSFGEDGEAVYKIKEAGDKSGRKNSQTNQR